MCLLSVIIPAYNAGISIENCLRSVPDNAEIIVVDDGSTDKTDEITDILLNSFPNLIVIHQANAGVSSARNRGLDIASGEFVCFVDADDIVNTIKMKSCIDIMHDNPSVDMLVYGMSFDYYRRNNCFKSIIMGPPYDGIKTLNECLSDIDSLFDSNCLSSLCTRIIKKSIIQNIRLREDMFLYEDLEFSLRILAYCKSVFFSKMIVYHYKQDSSHLASRIRRINDISEITEKINDALFALECDNSHIISALTGSLEHQRMSSLTYGELKKEYPDRATTILCRRIYGRIRHSIADFLKYHIWLIKSIRKRDRINDER